MLSNCPECGKLFNKITRDICPDCAEREDLLLKEVQKFLRENRNAGRHQILLEFIEVTGEMLDKWVESKRINLITDEDVEKQREKENKQKQLLQKIMGGQKKKETQKEEEEDTTKRIGMHFKREK